MISELPNNAKVGETIAGIVDVLNSVCAVEGIVKLNDVSMLWNLQATLALLDYLSITANHADSKRDLAEVRETVISMHTAYALHRRGDADEMTDFRYIWS